MVRDKKNIIIIILSLVIILLVGFIIYKEVIVKNKDDKSSNANNDISSSNRVTIYIFKDDNSSIEALKETDDNYNDVKNKSTLVGTYLCETANCNFNYDNYVLKSLTQKYILIDENTNENIDDYTVLYNYLENKVISNNIYNVFGVVVVKNNAYFIDMCASDKSSAKIIDLTTQKIIATSDQFGDWSAQDGLEEYNVEYDMILAQKDEKYAIYQISTGKNLTGYIYDEIDFRPSFDDDKYDNGNINQFEKLVVVKDNKVYYLNSNLKEISPKFLGTCIVYKDEYIYISVDEKEEKAYIQDTDGNVIADSIRIYLNFDDGIDPDYVAPIEINYKNGIYEIKVLVESTYDNDTGEYNHTKESYTFNYNTKKLTKIS